MQIRERTDTWRAIINGFPEIIRNEFNIPSNLEPIAIIALGYADTEKASPDRHSKDRKALESLVCYETF